MSIGLGQVKVLNACPGLGNPARDRPRPRHGGAAAGNPELRCEEAVGDEAGERQHMQKQCRRACRSGAGYRPRPSSGRATAGNPENWSEEAVGEEAGEEGSNDGGGKLSKLYFEL